MKAKITELSRKKFSIVLAPETNGEKRQLEELGHGVATRAGFGVFLNTSEAIVTGGSTNPNDAKNKDIIITVNWL